MTDRRLAVFGIVLAATACMAAWRAWPGSSIVVGLSSMEWSRNGEVVGDVVRDEVDGAARVQLPVDGTGVRWSVVFNTPDAATHRLFLSWDPGPDGLLFEILIDGERQPPPRDGWRPSSRHLVSDLGPRWLGVGDHLLEFIAREDVPEGSLVLRSLELRAPEE